MMATATKLFILALLAFVAAASASRVPRFPGCRGHAKYRITFHNFLVRRRFGRLIPRDGLVFSPLTGVSHSHRLSLFTIRGFASKEVEAVAETGDNGPLITLARKLRRMRRGIKTVVGAPGPTMPGRATSLILRVDCRHPFVTVIGMIAPSPDWIVQINNFPMWNPRARRFVRYGFGNLIAYDAGVDDGREFTPPGDTSLDKPTMPQKNIAPLVEDDTDRFRGRVVGTYTIRMMK